MTCGWAAVVLGGPAARDVFMRSPSLDVREDRFPPGAAAAGSVMRCPSIVLNDSGRLWVLCGWEFGEYMWQALLDAGVSRDIAPVSSSVALPENGGDGMIGLLRKHPASVTTISRPATT